MQTVKTILDRLLLLLADDLSYKLTEHELDLYTTHLGSYGLKPIRGAISAILEDKRPLGTFPPISEFERVLKTNTQHTEISPMAL